MDIEQLMTENTDAFMWGVIAFFALLFFGLIHYLYQRVTVSETIPEEDRVILKIAVPRNNKKSPLAAEQLFASLHGIIQNAEKAKQHFSFEIVAGEYGVFFIVVVNKRYHRFVENQIYSQYPEAEIKEVKDYTAGFLTKKKKHKVVELGQIKHYYLPIRTFNSFEVDPLASITGAVAKLKDGDEVWIQTIVRPLSNIWQDFGKNYVNKIRERTDEEGKKVGLMSGESEELRQIEVKNMKVGFQFVIRVMARSNDSASVNHLLEDVVASFRQYQTAQLNSIGIKKDDKNIFTYLRYIILGWRKQDTMKLQDKFIERFLDEKESEIINIEELASMYHLPNESVETPNIAWSMTRKLEFPLNIPTDQEQGVRVFGLTDYRNQKKVFGLKALDRRRHSYVIGKTGTGKSSMLKNMIIGDIYDGNGICVIDPHGDMIEDLLKAVPPHRVNDIILLDPSDMDYPIGINLLNMVNISQKDIVADGIIEIFKRHFGSSWGPRLQYILLNCILTLLECQNVSMLAITRMLVDHNYRKFLLKQVKDPVLLTFWEQEYEGIVKNPKMLAEVISPIQNKVGRFVSSPMIRNIIGQVTSTIKIEDIMNDGKILFINLAQGEIGEENSSLLGGMLVTKIFSSAMERVNILEKDRRDFYLYVDEFQNFTTQTFAKILSEARKYGLSLTVAHQYIDQLQEDIGDAIFGNIGTMVNFAVGPKDAQSLEKEYRPYLDYEDLVNLERFRFVCKLMIDGSQSKPFTGMSLRNNFKEYNTSKAAVLQNTRDKYSKPREDIESKIKKWTNQRYDDQGNLLRRA
jgi:hypothetical protein